MKRLTVTGSRGSILIVTLSTVTAISLLAAYTLNRAMPRVRMAYENAAWQEARVAAEGGVDATMNDLLLNATGFNPGAWTGWAEEKPPSATSAASSAFAAFIQKIQSYLPAELAALLGKIATQIGLPTTTASADKTVTAGAPLFMDNLRLSSTKGLPTEVDIRLWSLQPSANPNLRWFRIRATGTCALTPRSTQAPDALDTQLRRLSIRNVRPSLQKDVAGEPSTIPLPNVSRTVEVLVEPIHAFELALWTGETLTLPSSGTWNIDSFDSSDPNKSAPGGLYPGRGSKQVQANGNIASSAPIPYNSTTGPTIVANGTSVLGAVATTAGELDTASALTTASPSQTSSALQTTSDAEAVSKSVSASEITSVSGTYALDASRLHDDFYRKMVPMLRTNGEFQAPPTGPFVTGPLSAPTIYSIHANQGDFTIAPPTSGKTEAVVLLIDGNLSITKPLVIPPSVIAILFVRGNITFSADINSGESTSNRASQLMIFADTEEPARQTLSVVGPISVCSAFYGPRTDASLDGAAHWMGSLNVLSFKTPSGGTGGLHYDEALGMIGPVVGFRIGRFIEDVRE